MEYAKLGSSELSVSRICLGCMGFGNAVTGQHSWTVDETATREIVKHALDLGVNFFDTAIAYQNGTSEEYLGRALKDYAQRDEVVVATKFLPRSQQEIEAGVSGQEHIRRILDGMNQLVKAGKVRYIGIANCYAYQFAKANALAEKEGFAKFVSVQNHYNLLFREEEREMAKLCDEDNIAMTPYSALASGRLSRRPGETSKRLAEDSYAKLKYDGTAAADEKIILRVAELADKYGVSMTEIALSWLLTRVTAPVAGATKLHHIDGAVKAVELNLAAEDIAYLEELYVPHNLVGVMAQNTRVGNKKEQVWMKNAPKGMQ